MSSVKVRRLFFLIWDIYIVLERAVKKLSTKTASPKSYKKSLAKKHKKKHKGQKCIYKLLHRKKKKHKFRKVKKIILPILLGLFLLKSVFVSIVLKTLIFIASKGKMLKQLLLLYNIVLLNC